jgi:hypothetical protein
VTNGTQPPPPYYPPQQYYFYQPVPSKPCPRCGAWSPTSYNRCPYCGSSFKQEKYARVGGYLVILMGAIELGAAVILAYLTGYAEDGSFGLMCVSIFLVLGFTAVAGGLSAVARKNYALAVIGGVCTIFSVIGIVGLVLIAVSREDFD